MTCEYSVKEKYFKPNKCGSKEGFILSALWYIIPNFVFESACDCHDKAYFVGGCKLINDKARFLADAKFYSLMAENISSYETRKNPYKWQIKGLKKMAKVYYKAVRKFGHKSFNWFDTPKEYIDHLEKNEIKIAPLD